MCFAGRLLREQHIYACFPCLQEFADSFIFMNAVDTGWITAEIPLPLLHPDFSTPLDELDGAARVLDPILSWAPGVTPLFGTFLKDFKQTMW